MGFVLIGDMTMVLMMNNLSMKSNSEEQSREIDPSSFFLVPASETRKNDVLVKFNRADEDENGGENTSVENNKGFVLVGDMTMVVLMNDLSMDSNGGSSGGRGGSDGSRGGRGGSNGGRGGSNSRSLGENRENT